MHNFYDDYKNYDYYDEGANIDIRNKLDRAEAVYKDTMRDCNHAMRDKDYDKAKSLINDLGKELTEIKYDIEDIDASNPISIITGFFMAWTVHWLRHLVLSVLAPKTFGLSETLDDAMNTIERWDRPVKGIVDGTATADHFNFYKNTALKRVDTLVNICNRTIANISRLARDEERRNKDKDDDSIKTDKEVNESRALMDFKYALQYAYDSGLIIKEDRNDIFRTAVENVNNKNQYNNEY